MGPWRLTSTRFLPNSTLVEKWTGKALKPGAVQMGWIKLVRSSGLRLIRALSAGLKAAVWILPSASYTMNPEKPWRYIIPMPE